MVFTTSKYLLYFALHGNIIYHKSEFVTIKKIISNIMKTRFFMYDVEIKFNEEIINYDAIKDKLSEDVLLIITDINDLIIQDLIDEVLYVLGDRKVIRLRTSEGFNKTGLSDDELLDLYNKYLDKSNEINSIENDKLSNLRKNYKIENIPSLDLEEKETFCSLFLEKYDDLNGFSFFEDYSVTNSLFLNFHYLLKYFSLIDLEKLIIYYQKDAIKYLRQIRFYVSHSDDYNDNIKEILLYNHIIKKFNNEKLVYDPEEALDIIREEFDRLYISRRNYLINEMQTRFSLFSGEYKIYGYSDVKSRIYSSYSYVSSYIHKYFDKLAPLIKSFKIIDNYVVKFNSKMLNDDIISNALSKMKEHKIIKDYTAIHGSYTIYLLDGEHIAFLQGKWFEYYTAKLCEEVLENYKKQGYYPDYGIYQNIVVVLEGLKRELDLVIYVNGNVFYIENKVDGRKSLKYDIEKYNENIRHMNISKSNCYLVSLEGEEVVVDGIHVCSITSFITKFKKDVLKILEEHKTITEKARQKEIIKIKQEKEISDAIQKIKNTLLLQYNIDDEKEKVKFYKLLDKFKTEVSKLSFDNFKNYFINIKEIDFHEKGKVKKFIDKYEDIFFSAYENEDESVFRSMLKDALNISDPLFKDFIYPLQILNNDLKSLDNLPAPYVLNLMCGYGAKSKDINFVYNTLMRAGSKQEHKYLFFAYIMNNEAIDITCVEEFFSILISSLYSLKELFKGKNHFSYREQILYRNNELEFLLAVSLLFMEKVYGKLYIDGIRYTNIADLAFRVYTNPDNFYHLVTSEYGMILKDLKFYQNYFQTKKTSPNPANYLFLNRKKLLPEDRVFFEVDEKTLIFQVKRSEQANKLLNLLLYEEIIASFKEVKKADLYFAIFSSYDNYLWYSNGDYIGEYLSSKFDVCSTFPNFHVSVREKDYLVALFKVINDDVIVALFDKQILKFALLKKNKDDISGAIINIKNEDFIYGFDDVVIECTNLIGGKNE